MQTPSEVPYVTDTDLSDLFLPLEHLCHIHQVCSNKRPAPARSCYTIYPIADLDELIEERQDTPEEDPDYAYSIRFLIDRDFNIWFAPSGIANSAIPNHYRMTGQPFHAAQCVAAGELRFSPDFSQIIACTHQSGDFRPSFRSLRWLLAVMVANESTLGSIKCAPQFTLEQLNEHGGIKAYYRYGWDHIQRWVRENFPSEWLQLIRSQPTKKRVLRYEEVDPQTIQRIMSITKCDTLPSRDEICSDESEEHSPGYRP